MYLPARPQAPAMQMECAHMERCTKGARMREVIAINPFRCRMWELHDRLEQYLTEQSCQAEIGSFRSRGQLMPALGRRLKADPAYDVELVYGARRLFVARHLNKELLVELCDLEDRDAIVAMEVENRQRVDISPYERGLSYSRWLNQRHFSCQEDLARALNISTSQVSRLLKLSRLPAVIVGAFPSPADICEGWGLDLAILLEDPLKRNAIVQRARALAGEGTPRDPRAIYRELIAVSRSDHKAKPTRHDEIVKDAHGVPLFRIRHQTKTVALLLPADQVSAVTLASISESIAAILTITEHR